jgi:hypothetical protein
MVHVTRVAAHWLKGKSDPSGLVSWRHVTRHTQSDGMYIACTTTLYFRPCPEASLVAEFGLPVLLFDAAYVHLMAEGIVPKTTYVGEYWDGTWDVDPQDGANLLTASPDDLYELTRESWAEVFAKPSDREYLASMWDDNTLSHQVERMHVQRYWKSLEETA